MPDGTIAHAEIEIEGSLLMLADENLEWGNKSPLTIGGNPMTFGLYVVDVEAAFKKAVDAGATVVMPVDDMFYGDRLGQVMDPYGYKWMIITHMKTIGFEEMQKGYDKLLAEEQKSK